MTMDVITYIIGCAGAHYRIDSVRGHLWRRFRYDVSKLQDLYGQTMSLYRMYVRSTRGRDGPKAITG